MMMIIRSVLFNLKKQDIILLCVRNLMIIKFSLFHSYLIQNSQRSNFYRFFFIIFLFQKLFNGYTLVIYLFIYTVSFYYRERFLFVFSFIFY